MKPRAVVVGLESITGLQTARILAARQVPVVALTGDPRHFCSRTRVCERIVPADVKSDAFLDTLTQIGPSLGERAVLYPCTDASVLHISRNRDLLTPWYHVVLPAPDVVELLVDKIEFYRYAEREGLPIPHTALLANREDAEREAEALPYPAIVKPPLRTPRWERETSVKAYRVETPSALLALYDAVRSWADVLIAQEWIDGRDSDLYSCNCYYGADGAALVTFVARKLRQWPPRTGTSSLGEECRNDVVLRETLRLFDGVGFRGLGYVELKRDARTGRHSIIEPNIGRPTGRSAIAEAGGVELLYAMYCDAVGLPLPDRLEQRYVGAKWIDHRRDFQSAFYYWRHRELTLRGWARSWQGAKASAVLSRHDPEPFALELWQSLGKALNLAVRDRRRAPRRELTRSVLARAQNSRPPRTRAGAAPAPLTLEPFAGTGTAAHEWDELAERTGNVFATREWLLTWWRHFGRGRQLLLTAGRDADGTLAALFPLYVVADRPLRAARFLGHGAGDELGPICAPEARPAAAAALLRLLDEAGVDLVLGEQLPAPAEWSRLLGGRVLRREGSPILRLDGTSWDELLASWTGNLRQQVRRFERRLQREHELGYRLAGGMQLDADLADLFRLHAARWAEADSRFGTSQRPFQQEFARIAHERGWLRLWFLELDGTPVSVWYGLRFGGAESYYQAGRDPAWEHRSVGFVLLAHTIRAALEDGTREYRFLRGGEGFKYRFASADPGLETIGVAAGRSGRAALALTATLPRRLRTSGLLHRLAA